MDEEISAHEPQLAFDGGPFGIKILGRLTKEAPVASSSGGYLVFEVGLGQGEPMMARLEKTGSFLDRTAPRSSGEHPGGESAGSNRCGQRRHVGEDLFHLGGPGLSPYSWLPKAMAL